MKILVVEDEHRIANTLKKGLELERYIVDVAYTGDEGYDMATSEDYDILILDRMLPGMDGMIMCQKLREQNDHVPILMLTAKSQTEDKIDGLDVGADDYMTKPFSFEELLARIRALSRRPKQVVESILTVDDLSLDPKLYTVTRGGKEITLSSKEFSLLEYLMRHPNTILTKQQIIRNGWDYDADVLPNTVEVYIRNLRQKIDKPFKTQLIHTVRGFGYKIGR